LTENAFAGKAKVSDHQAAVKAAVGFEKGAMEKRCHFATKLVQNHAIA
jgi:hypothetical protein